MGGRTLTIRNMNAIIATARATRTAAFEKALQDFTLGKTLARSRYRAACPRYSRNRATDPAATYTAGADPAVVSKYDEDLKLAKAKYHDARVRANDEYLAAIASVTSEGSDEWEAGLEDV